MESKAEVWTTGHEVPWTSRDQSGLSPQNQNDKQLVTLVLGWVFLINANLSDVLQWAPPII